jgi:hypothetical protein
MKYIMESEHPDEVKNAFREWHLCEVTVPDQDLYPKRYKKAVKQADEKYNALKELCAKHNLNIVRLMENYTGIDYRD